MNPAHSNEIYRPPKIGAAQIRLLQKLCLACAVSGDEREVRSIVLDQLRPAMKDRPGEMKVDALGNVLVTSLGSDSPAPRRLRVMLAAHMDEVGFMITQDEEKGIYRFDTVGGVDIRQLPGKPVWIGAEHTPGVIGAKPIHLTKAEELKSVISLETLRIDVSPEGKNVKVGDRAVFATPFARLGPSLRAKALDNRLGVATLIELVKNAPPNIDLLAAFTTQEEIGGGGSRVAAYAFNPDLAIAVDSSPAYDMPTWDEDNDGKPAENAVFNTRLGAGPAIYLSDARTISDPRLVRYLVKTAEANQIPYQFRQPGGGSTDAGPIHRQREGIPSISVSVPGRYPHTSASISRLSDWQNTLALLHAALAQMPADLLTSL